MKYRPFSDSQADRFLRFALDDEFARDREDLIDLLQQAKRANALAHHARELAGVEHYEWCDVIKERRREIPPPECDCAVGAFKQALAAYLGEGEE